MDTVYLTTFAGLAGVLIGGVTSFSTAWMTQRTQLHVQAINAEKERKELLFNDFIREAARLYGDALVHQKEDVSEFINLYTLLTRMRLIANRETILAGESVVQEIIDAYLSPNKSLSEVRVFANEGGFDAFLKLGEACRAELSKIK